MIKIFHHDHPDSLSVKILLEELGLRYKLVPFESMSEHDKCSEIPLLVPEMSTPLMIDEVGGGHEKIVLFGSSAILLYLAEKSDCFFSGSSHDKYAILQWLMFQASGISPFLGEARHYKYIASAQSYTVERYNKEVLRLLRVLDDRLEKQEWIVKSYSIGDISIFGWIDNCLKENKKFQQFSGILKWYDSIHDRPAVLRSLGYG